MNQANSLKLSLDFGFKKIPIGHLAYRKSCAYFEYNSAFLNAGFSISPFHLPLQSGLVSADINLFDGLHGVFNDSLPDGWGRLLVDRYLRQYNIHSDQLSPLGRLQMVGSQGMGALCYEPAQATEYMLSSHIDLDHYALQAKEIINGKPADVLEALLAMNGSSAGARPKVMVMRNPDTGELSHGQKNENTSNLNDEHWLVKFLNSVEPVDSGAIEYVYYKMAQAAGLNISSACLLPSRIGPGYFATKRFDRDKNKRFHMVSACGLLNSDFRTPCLDYKDILKITFLLTNDQNQILQAYRLAVFNVLGHNQDDHGKNIAFVMNDSGQWSLAPAYDLTFSSGLRGEQSTMVMGVGKNISLKDLKQLGLDFGLKCSCINDVIECTREALDLWPQLSAEYGVSAHNQRLISQFINK